MTTKPDFQKKIAIYTRVSSHEQKIEGLSLRAQKNKLENYCVLKDYWVFNIYSDEGVSAGTIKKRKGFTKMLEDAKTEKFSAIIITKLDRAFRNTKDAIETLDMLQEIKIDFISLGDNIDTTTAMGKFFFTIIASLAQLERELTGERVTAIHEHKFENGKFVGKPPIGYKYNKKKIVVLDKKKSKMVQDIFAMTIEDRGYKEICTKYALSPQTYYNIIDNITYTGMIKHNKKTKKGVHTPIISEHEFLLAQQKRTK